MSSTTEYEVIITTSNGYDGAGGADNVVFLQMVGENGEKNTEVNLREMAWCLFKRGGRDVFKVKTEYVGMPVILKLRFKDTSGKDPWAVRDVLVKYGNKEALFPIHDWITDDISVIGGKALLQHKLKNRYVASMIRQEVEKGKLLQWVELPGPSDQGRGLPRYVELLADNLMMENNLPFVFRPTEVWSHSFYGKAIVTAALGKLKEFETKIWGIGCLEDYESLFKLWEPNKERSSYLDRWRTDEEFGRQQLNGISPTSFERCTEIPDNCQISSKDVDQVLTGKTFEQEMEANNIYIADYSKVFQGVKRNKNSDGDTMFCPDAICLYHVNDSDNFVPIAIQLVPNDPQTIFTPKDSEDDWLLAKMYFRVAFSNLHEWHYHFLLTHIIMEPFAVALFRCLPRSHPLYKLLRPHLQTVTIINSLARDQLIAAGSDANKALAMEAEGLSRHSFENFTMDDLMIPDLLKKKGLLDKKKLPKYHYRDDALALWEIIQKFISDVISTYYQDDEDVTLDKDLQQYVKDVGEEGLGWSDGNTRGIPVPIKTVDDLIRICTCVIFTSSVQHAAVNFPQYDIYKFIPMTPAAMRLPPHKKGEATMRRIMESLPNAAMSIGMISLTNSLSAFRSDEIYLGQYPVQLFTDPEVLSALKNYNESLKKYADDVHKRNKEVEFPYDHLLPSKIPNSIAI